MVTLCTKIKDKDTKDLTKQKRKENEPVKLNNATFIYFFQSKNPLQKINILNPNSCTETGDVNDYFFSLYINNAIKLLFY